MKKYKDILDWVAIALGVITIFLFYLLPCEGVWNCVALYTLCGASGLLGIYYVAGIAWSYWGRRVEFDLHIIGGHFLRKVVCLAVLLPSLITCLLLLFHLKDDLFVNELYFEYNECVEDAKGKELFAQKPEPTLFWVVLYNFIDSGNQHMATTSSGRTWSTLIALLGMVLLNGLFVSSVINAIDHRKERWRSGTITYKRYHLTNGGEFAVVIGANEVAPSIIKNLLSGEQRCPGDLNFKCEAVNRYVILHTSAKPEAVRDMLKSHLSESEIEKVIIYCGLRNSEEEMKRLYLTKASEVYVLGESVDGVGGENYHDAMNMECVNVIAKLLNETLAEREAENERVKEEAKRMRELQKPLPKYSPVRKVCKVLFEYQTTNSIFQFADIPTIVKNNLVFIPFNRYDSWARKVIVDGRHEQEDKNKSITYTFLDGNGITDPQSEEYVHFVVVGMSNMGISMGVEALLQAHYVNYAKARTRLTFIDTKADKEMDFFKGRYYNLFALARHRYFDANVKTKNMDDELVYGQHYATEWIDPIKQVDSKWSHLSDDGDNFVDVEVEFVKGELESEGVRAYLSSLAEVKESKLTIAICLTQTHQSVAASLYMPTDIYAKVQQVWVYQPESADIIINLNNTEQKDLRYKKLRPFGMLYGEYVCDRRQYLGAMLVNLQYDMMIMEKKGEDNAAMWPASLVDKFDPAFMEARKSWRKCSIHNKLSNRNFVDSIPLKIRSITPEANCGQPLAERIAASGERLAVLEHNRWNVQQLLLGWAPAKSELNDIFADLNNGEDVTERYCDWRERSGIGRQMHQANVKDDVKGSELRIHPNICDYDHMDRVDSGAKHFDDYLNRAIPKILESLDKKE